MTGKTATEVRLEALEDDQRECRTEQKALSARIGVLERTMWIMTGMGTGVGALATLLVSGFLKRLVGG